MAYTLSGYIGTYTEGKNARAKGIYAFRMNGETGIIEDLRLAAESPNPAYLALSPSKKYLYAANELSVYQEQPSGAISAFRADKAGGLEFLNRQSSRGTGPCHLAVHPGGTFAVAANYAGGTLCVLPLDKQGPLGEPLQVIRFKGSGPDKERQEGPHAHSFLFDREGRRGFACDLGTDRVMIYDVDPKAAEPLRPAPEPFISLKPGSGPRHGVFHPSGAFAYYLSEMASTVDVLSYNGGSPDRPLSPLMTVPALPEGNTIASTASAVRISGDGKFLYTSNRGHDSITLFRIQKKGTLQWAAAFPSGGRTPRDFNLDPEGNFLLALHQNSDNLVIFRINPRTGALKKEREYPVPSPVCLVFS
jgi:6-phosphogluconolactonase